MLPSRGIQLPFQRLNRRPREAQCGPGMRGRRFLPVSSICTCCHRLRKTQVPFLCVNAPTECVHECMWVHVCPHTCLWECARVQAPLLESPPLRCIDLGAQAAGPGPAVRRRADPVTLSRALNCGDVRPARSRTGIGFRLRHPWAGVGNGPSGLLTVVEVRPARPFEACVP